MSWKYHDILDLYCVHGVVVKTLCLILNRDCDEVFKKNYIHMF